jgi:hypothetical protein
MVLAATAAWTNESFGAVWAEVQRLTELEDQALLDQLDDLMDSDIVGEDRVPLSTRIVVFVAVWGHSVGNRRHFLRSLRLPFESLEHRAERDGWSMGALGPVKLCCPYLQEVIDDDHDWTHHPIPGEDRRP